jgi:hypothetical protein
VLDCPGFISEGQVIKLMEDVVLDEYVLSPSHKDYSY